MGTKQTPGEHWDREQMARDTEGEPPEGTPQGDVWNRNQMEIDDAGEEADAVQRTDLGDEAPVGGLSGRGQPSGESHWDRVDDDETG
jgi:hypothetical protein